MDPMDPRSPRPAGIPKPGRRHDDDTKLPIGDTSGEMEDAGGGRKSKTPPPAEPTPPAGAPIEPQGEAGETEPPSEASEAARPDRSRSRPASP
jgi:hypothetical protein